MNRTAALLAVTLVAGIALSCRRGEPEERAQRTPERGRPAAATEEPANTRPRPAGELTRITVETRGERTVLQRRDGAWRMVSPADAPVDSFNVEALTSALRTAAFSVVDERPGPDALKKYGLSPPRFVVTTRWDDTEEVLKGGAENPFDGSVYLQRGGDPRVFSAPGQVRIGLDKTPYELRDKQVLAVPQDEVRRIELRAGKVAYVLERAEKKDAWRVVRPYEDAAQASEVTRLLSALRAVRATAFLSDTPSDRQRAGVAAPVASATFTLARGDGVRLAFGRVGDQLFVLRVDGSAGALAEVPAVALAALERDPTSFRDRSLLRFEKERVTRVTVERPGSPRIVVERASADGGASEWRLVEPRQGPARAFKMSQVLWALDALPAKAIVEERPKSLARYGLDRPERTVTLGGERGAVLARLVLGSVVGSADGLRYARGSLEGVATVEEARLAELPESADELVEAPATSSPDAG